MSKFILPLLALLVVACSGKRGKFTLEGQIKGINEDNALITSTDGGLDSIDTLHIRDGAFKFQCDLPEQATYHVIFSNNSELTLWGHSGDAITLEGEAQDLRNIKVGGNDENELYTQFRLAINALSTPDSLTILAHEFILQNVQSPVAAEVYRQYYLTSPTADNNDVHLLLDTLRAAQPESPALQSYHKLIQQRDCLAPGKPLPPFKLTDTKGTVHTLADYADNYLILVVWAAWQSTNNNAFYQIRQLLQDHPDLPISVLDISLDVNTDLLDMSTRDNSWPTIAPLRGWDVPYIQKLGIHTIPYTILIDKKGKVVAASSDFNRDIKPKVEILK